jgi:hypothetical protein
MPTTIYEPPKISTLTSAEIVECLGPAQADGSGGGGSFASPTPVGRGSSGKLSRR